MQSLTCGMNIVAPVWRRSITDFARVWPEKPVKIAANPGRISWLRREQPRGPRRHRQAAALDTAGGQKNQFLPQVSKSDGSRTEAPVGGETGGHGSTGYGTVFPLRRER